MLPPYIFPFLDLPPELQNHVISLIQDQATLYNLCQCSRVLHNLTIQHLYRDIKIKHEERSGKGGQLAALFGEGAECGFFQIVYDITVLILRKPERARLVRSFTLSKEACPHSFPSRERIHNRIIVAIRQARWSPADGSRQLRDIKRSLSIEALVAVLLPSLPQLERLKLTFSPATSFSIPYYDRMLVDIVHRCGNLPETAFEHLKSLMAPSFDHVRFATTGSHPGQEGIWPHQLLAFLESPSMRSIEGCLCIYDHRLPFPSLYDQLDRLEPASSSVVSLVLESYYFDGKVIRVAVIACRALKTLELRLLKKLSAASEIADLATAAVQASENLETLSVCYGSNEQTLDSQLRNISSAERYIISLVGYPRVRNVTLGVFFLFGPSLIMDASRDEGLLRNENGETILRRLPAQIESLRIIVGHGEEKVPIFANMEAILWRKKEGSLQRLMSVIVEYSGLNRRNTDRGQRLVGFNDQDKALLHLKECAKRLDVNFNVDYTDESVPVWT